MPVSGRLVNVVVALVISVGLVAGAGYIYMQRLADQAGTAASMEMTGAVRAGERIAAEWGAEVGRVRNQPDANFDSLKTYIPRLAAQREAILSARERMGELPSEIRNGIRSYLSRLRAKQEVIERFKTDYAVVRNSQDFLLNDPEGGKALLASAREGGRTPVEDATRLMFEELEQFLRTPDRGWNMRTDHTLDALVEVSDGTPDAEKVKEIAAHVEVLLERYELAEDRFEEAISNRKIRNAAATLLSRIDSHDQARRISAGYLGYALYAVAGIAILYWLSLVMRFFRGRRAVEVPEAPGRAAAREAVAMPEAEVADADPLGFLKEIPAAPAMPAAPISAAPVEPVMPAAPVSAAPVEPAMPAAPISAAPVEPAMPAAPISAAPVEPAMPAAPVSAAPVEPAMPAAPVSAAPVEPAMPVAPVSAAPVASAPAAEVGTAGTVFEPAVAPGIGPEAAPAPVVAAPSVAGTVAGGGTPAADTVIEAIAPAGPPAPTIREGGAGLTTQAMVEAVFGKLSEVAAELDRAAEAGEALRSPEAGERPEEAVAALLGRVAGARWSARRLAAEARGALEGEEAEPDWQRIDLRDTLTSLLDTLDAAHRERITAVLLPGAVARVDRQAFEAAMDRVLGHALDAAARHPGDAGHVELTLTTHEGRHCISCVEHGPGTPAPGAGGASSWSDTLDLDVARRLVTAQGGEFEAVTWPPYGSRIRISIHPADVETFVSPGARGAGAVAAT